MSFASYYLNRAYYSNDIHIKLNWVTILKKNTQKIIKRKKNSISNFHLAKAALFFDNY